MSGWIATGIALAAFVFSGWQWWQRKGEAKAHDREARIARVSDKLVQLSKTAHRASQGSPDDVNSMTAVQRDLDVAIASARLDLPACTAMAKAPGVLAALSAEQDAFQEVAEAVANLAHGSAP